MNLRPYQSGAIESLWQWFMRHQEGQPIMDCAVGAGKSLMIAATIQRALTEYPATRVIVIAHQMELIQQNLDKLLRIWPDADVGVYCAALGRKELGHRITYATIGSIYKAAHLMGAVHLVMADECHLISRADEGMWRLFIGDMRSCGNPGIRVVGWTGTPFRGGGIWLTAGKDALFTGVAARVTMTDLLQQGYLVPLVPVATSFRYDTSNVRTAAGDYVVSDLAKVTDKKELVESTCDEIVRLANGRKRMLVFAVNVEHAHHVNDALCRRGIASAVITGKTPKTERISMLKDYAQSRLRCMVSIGVLTTGFDQPDIDFIALLRATKSPTLAIQMCGRGMRTADKKTECAFADFTDTIERLGPIDQIKGKNPKASTQEGAPYRLCPECGSHNAATAENCVDCGYEFPPVEHIKHRAKASSAPVLSMQAAPRINTYPVDRVAYALHPGRDGKPDSMRVDYHSGLRRVASEWVCFEHGGFAGEKARQWWIRRSNNLTPAATPSKTDKALEDAVFLSRPQAITVNETGRYPEIIRHQWTTYDPDPVERIQGRTEEQAA